MRRVTEQPSKPEFDKWLRKATKARDELLKLWKAECEAALKEGREIAWTPKINEKLYKELREIFLYDAFYKKCAYCEVNHSEAYPIQVDHYRPKRKVTVNGQKVEHPGYFWLAYEWWNLVPSCAYCNSSHHGYVKVFTVRCYGAAS